MIAQDNQFIGISNNQLVCNKERHDSHQLNYVCISNNCINKGLVCQLCIKESHKDHNVQQLQMFLNTYKESCQLSQALPTLKRDSKLLGEIQQELSHYLDTFAKSLQDVILEAKKRILANIECDKELVDSVLEVEQKHTNSLEELEQQMIAQPNEAQNKILSLISRLKMNFGSDISSRFTVSTFREDNHKTILLLLRKNHSIKNNIFQETPKFTKDLYMYLKQIDSALEAYDTKRTNYSYNMNNQSHLDISQSTRSVSPLQGFSYSNSFQPTPPQQYESSPTRSASGSRVNIFARQPASNRVRQPEDKRDDSTKFQKAIQSSTTNIFNIQEQFYPLNKDSNNNSMTNLQHKQQTAPPTTIPVSFSSNKKQPQQQQQLQKQQNQSSQQQLQQQQSPSSDPILIQQQYQLQQQNQDVFVSHIKQQQQIQVQQQKQSQLQQEEQEKQDQQSSLISQIKQQQQLQSLQQQQKNQQLQQQEQNIKQDQLQQNKQQQPPQKLTQQKQYQQQNQLQLEQMTKQEQQQPQKQLQQISSNNQLQQQLQQANQQQIPSNGGLVQGSGNYNFASRPSDSNSPFARSGQKQNQTSTIKESQQQNQIPKIGSNALITSLNIKEADISNISQNEIRGRGISSSNNISNPLNKSDNKQNSMNIYSDVPLSQEDFNKHLQSQIKPASPPKQIPQSLQINTSSPLLNNFNQGQNKNFNDNFLNKSHISYMQSQHSPNSRVNTAQNGGSKSFINISNSPASNTSFLDHSRVAYNQIQQSIQMAHDGKIKAIELMGNDKIASGGEDKLIKIWERTDYKLLNTLEGHNACITVIKYHNMSRILASGGEDDLVIVWKPVPLLQKVHVLKGHDDSITCVTFQNERTLISSSKDMKLIIWDIEKGIGKNKLDYSDSIINDIAIYNKMIMCVSDKYVQFWELSTYKLLKKVEAHDNTVNQISLIHRKRQAQIYIVTCANDGCIYIWDGDNKYDEVDKISEDSNWNIKCFDYNSHYDMIIYGCNSKVDSLSKIVVYSLEQRKVTQTISHYTTPINQIKCIYKDIYVALENNFIDNVKIQKNSITTDY